MESEKQLCQLVDKEKRFITSFSIENEEDLTAQLIKWQTKNPYWIIGENCELNVLIPLSNMIFLKDNA